MKKTNSIRKTELIALFMLLAMMTGITVAQDSPATPTDANSAMFTLNDLYNRLDAGTAGAKRTGAFTEPSAAPAKTMRTLNELMAKAPTIDAAGADSNSVLSGTTFWGLKSDFWGYKSGSMPNVGAQTITPTTTSQTITRGYHNGSGSVAGDANLVSGNIKRGATVFGVAGDTNVVSTDSADADSSMIKFGKKAWVKGSQITGKLTGGTVCTGTFSSQKRWCDNGNGTITDVTTGLVWLKTVSSTLRYFCASATTDALWYVYTLQNGVQGLTDSSANGDWRIPTLREMQSLRTGVEGFATGVPQSFTSVFDGYCWTTTNSSGLVTEYNLVTINLVTGGTIDKTKSEAHSNPLTAIVWPVRSKF